MKLFSVVWVKRVRICYVPIVDVSFLYVKDEQSSLIELIKVCLVNLVSIGNLKNYVQFQNCIFHVNQLKR